MAKKLDLNALDKPTLELTLRDDARTTFRLTVPETKLVERLLAAASELDEVTKSRDAQLIKALYTLAADLISNNVDYITVTAEELRDKYRVTFGDLIIIFSAYLDFVNELHSAKN